MVMKFAYYLVSIGSLALLALAAPSGALLTSHSPSSKVSRSTTTTTTTGGRTVRSHVPAFIFLGGGYRGGK